MREKEVFNHIDGKWVASESGSWRARENPANSKEIVCRVTQSLKEDVDKAVDAAVRSYEKWRLTPAPKRGEILYRAAELLVQRKEEFARVQTIEMGKILNETLGDVQEAIDMTYYMAGEGRRMFGETTHSELENKDMKSIKQPLGIVALITPWNFPMAIPSWKICPALICGNTVVFKPASYTSYSASLFVQTLIDAGIPAGVLNFVTGSGSTIGDYLVNHKDVNAVSFTGSSEVGFGIEKKAATRHIPVSAEMGGKNAIVIMDDANLELALEGTIWGGYGTTGQRCTAASRVIAHKDIIDKFRKLLIEKIKKIKLGSGLDKTVDMGPVVSKSQRENVHKYTEIGKKEGAKLITGGGYCENEECKDGWFYLPTLFDDVTVDMIIAQEEIFGPVVSLIEFENLKDGIEKANSTNYGLSLALFTQDVNNSAIAERDFESTIVYINAPTIGAEIHLPFGGIKNTGLIHKEAGGRGGAIDFFSRIKVIYRDFSGRLQRAQIDHD
jgi:acyl-CoA reductase-like NAD-dependent aldehyde dehydrogenase